MLRLQRSCCFLALSYQTIRCLEQFGLLTRQRERAPKTGQLTGGIIYELHPEPVPAEHNTFKPSKTPKKKRVHPASKAALVQQQNPSSDLVPNLSVIGLDQGKHLSEEEAHRIPDLPGTDLLGTGRSGIINKKDEKTTKEDQEEEEVLLPSGEKTSFPLSISPIHKTPQQTDRRRDTSLPENKNSALSVELTLIAHDVEWGRCTRPSKQQAAQMVRAIQAAVKEAGL